MPPNGHALLSASSSDRWLHCPPSARLCESYADKGSDYAAEGTDAHALCEYKLRKALGMQAEDPTENLTWFNQEMDDCATGYAAYILKLVEAAKETCADPVVLIEQRVDFSRWVEQGFGTSDAILIADGTLSMRTASRDVRKKGSCKMKSSSHKQRCLNGFLAEVSSGNRPILCILHQVCGDQPNIGLHVRENSDNAGSSANLPVQAFNHVGRRDLPGVQFRERVKRQRVL